MLLLVGLVAALVTERGRESARRLASHGATALGIARNWRELGANRCLKLGVLVVLQLAVSWGAIASQHGIAATKGALGYGPAPRDTFVCGAAQRMLHGQALHKIRDGIWRLMERTSLRALADSSSTGESILAASNELES